MKKLLFVLVVLELLVIACTPKPLSIDVPQLEPRLVLNAQVVPSQAIIVTLTRSFGALSFSEENGDEVSSSLVDSLLVSGATVKITYNGQTDSLVELSPGLYVGATAPQQINDLYTITCIDHERNLSCSASAAIQEYVPFTLVDPEMIINDNDTVFRINFEFIDPSDENYYMVNVYSNARESEDFGDVNSFFGNGSNLLLVNENFSDRVFTNDTVKGSVNLYSVNEGDSIVVTLSNISRDYYDYLTLRDKSGNLFSQITQEPINYPTNVQGGYGFFNTHIPDARFFFLNNLSVVE